ncbi:MAG: DUF2911 domain-containing protein [Cyclobacteriaceae bacterium]
MKNLFFAVMISVLGIIGFVAFKFLNETRTSPKSSSNYKSEELKLKVDYSRPYKRGRTIFGGLVPYGEYWRTGADEATEIVFYQDVNFGGEQVDEGRYRLFTFPGTETWTVVLNSELSQWGAFEPNYELDVARIEVPIEKTKNSLEQLLIDFEDGQAGAILVIAWDNVKAEVLIQ